MIIERYEYPFQVWHCLPDDASPDEIAYAKGEWPPDRIWGPVGRPNTQTHLTAISPGVMRMLGRSP